MKVRDDEWPMTIESQGKLRRIAGCPWCSAIPVKKSRALTAAAPDLLKAAKLRISAGVAMGRYPKDDPRYAAALRKAALADAALQKAIAKAEGHAL